MSAGKVVAIVGGVVGGVAALGLVAWRYLVLGDREIKDIEPDMMPPPSGKTGYKRVDAILDKLRASSRSSGIPLGLMVGWIAKESGGKLAEKPQPGPGDTSMDERGYYQLTPEESKALGLDHQRLSTDADYSIDAGVKLVRKYQSVINDLGFPAGTSYYWRLVKLAHSMGSGQVKKVVKAAQDANQADSWDQLATFALGMKINGPQPKKWFPFVDDTRAPTKDSSVYRVGKPFGFGSESQPVVGMLHRATRRELPEEGGLNLMGAVDMTDDAGWRLAVATYAAAHGDRGKWVRRWGGWSWQDSRGTFNSAPPSFMRAQYPGMAPLFDLVDES